MKYFSLLLILWTLLSCSDSGPGYTPDIYVAGNVFAGNRSKACYWKNGVRVDLTDGNSYAVAYSIFVSGADVYVAGVNDGKALYWKNGMAGDLDNIGLSFSTALSIVVAGEDVHVTGNVQGANPSGSFDDAAYWKNGSLVRLTHAGSTGAGNSIAVFGPDVYIAGTCHNAAVYWKNGTEVVLDDDPFFLGTAITVADNAVHVAGYHLSPNGQTEVATYWRNNIGVSLTSAHNYASAHAIALGEGGAYVAGRDFDERGRSQATVWHQGNISYLEGDDSRSSVANSIGVFGRDVYVAGFEWDGNAVVMARYWKNGRGVSLTSDQEQGIAYSIFVK